MIILNSRWCVIPCVHLGEKFFTDPSLGFVFIYLINTLLGIIPQISLLLMDILGEAEVRLHIGDCNRRFYNLDIFSGLQVFGSYFEIFSLFYLNSRLLMGFLS